MAEIVAGTYLLASACVGAALMCSIMPCSAVAQFCALCVFHAALALLHLHAEMTAASVLERAVDAFLSAAPPGPPGRRARAT